MTAIIQEQTATEPLSREQAPPRADRNTNTPLAKSVSKTTPAQNPAWEVVLLPVVQISPNPFQPRVAFDPSEMEELVSSVRAHGVLQPVTVRTFKTTKEDPQASNGHRKEDHNTGAAGYYLVSGERRLRACKEAGRKTIPAIIRDDLSDVAVAELALIENVQRSNLTVIEEAAGYRRLMLEFRLKEERIAKKVGKSVATIKETIKLLSLPEPVQRLLAQRTLTPSHGQQLLRLAPFERVCILVAQKAAQDHLTATSLATTLLPNPRELKEKGLLVELDYKTQFDWKEQCGQCPHKAYVQSGYSSYCLSPLEWKRKQDAAVEMKKQEAARVMEEARQEGRTAVETEKLPAGSYSNLSYMTLPAGCSASCPCRGEATDPSNPTRKVPVCLDPKRLSDLREAERQAHQEARQQRYTALWSEAKEVLQEEYYDGEWQKTALLLARSVVLGSHYGYGEESAWQALVRQVGRDVDLRLSWEKLFDAEEECEALALLQEVDPNRLLLFVTCLLLAQEAHGAIRFGGPTPDLDLVLGRATASQPELEETESEEAHQEDQDGRVVLHDALERRDPQATHDIHGGEIPDEGDLDDAGFDEEDWFEDEDEPHPLADAASSNTFSGSNEWESEPIAPIPSASIEPPSMDQRAPTSASVVAPEI